MSERSLISAFEQLFAQRGERNVSWIGDDCAVVQSKPYCVTSVDSIVDGVHFRLDDERVTVADVGHKALAVALSDLAAMAAEPGEAYISLGIPDGLSDSDVLSLAAAIERLAEQTAVTVAGGDLVRSPTLFCSVTVVGWSDEAQQLIGRGGAKAAAEVVVAVAVELGVQELEKVGRHEVGEVVVAGRRQERRERRDVVRQHREECAGGSSDSPAPLCCE